MTLAHVVLVVDRAALLVHDFDYLLGLRQRNLRVVFAVQEKQRRADALRIGDRGLELVKFLVRDRIAEKLSGSVCPITIGQAYELPSRLNCHWPRITTMAR